MVRPFCAFFCSIRDEAARPHAHARTHPSASLPRRAKKKKGAPRRAKTANTVTTDRRPLKLKSPLDVGFMEPSEIGFCSCGKLIFVPPTDSVPLWTQLHLLSRQPTACCKSPDRQKVSHGPLCCLRQQASAACAHESGSYGKAPSAPSGSVAP